MRVFQVLDVTNNELVDMWPLTDDADVGANAADGMPGLGGDLDVVTLKADQNRLSGALNLHFERMPRLKDLSAAHNALSSLPGTLAHCQNLDSLKAGDNKIAALPFEITQLKKVKTIDLENCPLKDSKVKKYLAQGGKGLKDLWKYLVKQEKRAQKKGKGKGKKGKKKKQQAAEEDDDEAEGGGGGGGGGATGIQLAQEMAALKVAEAAAPAPAAAAAADDDELDEIDMDDL